jgi:hypothetical protein
MTTELWKESLNCDGQQFHEQQNEHIKGGTMTFDAAIKLGFSKS